MSFSRMSGTLYVLYNADASIVGKLRYGYRKICHSTEENPACAACTLHLLRRLTENTVC